MPDGGVSCSSPKGRLFTPPGEPEWSHKREAEADPVRCGAIAGTLRDAGDRCVANGIVRRVPRGSRKRSPGPRRQARRMARGERVGGADAGAEVVALHVRFRGMQRSVVMWARRVRCRRSRLVVRGLWLRGSVVGVGVFLVLAAPAFAAAPSLSKSFAMASIPVGGTTSLSFTVSVPKTTVGLNQIAFVDTLPAGLRVATPSGLSGSCGGGTITATAGSNSIALSGAAIAGGSSCTFPDRFGIAAGTNVNATSTVSSSDQAGAAATASITIVAPPKLLASFGISSVPLGGSTSLSFVINNPNAGPTLTGVSFTDALPAGVVVASPAAASSSCPGGTIGAIDRFVVRRFLRRALAAGASCIVSVSVTGTTAGTKVTTTSSIGSLEGGIGAPASATLVVGVGAPVIGTTFAQRAIPVGGTVSLAFTITNPNPSTPLSAVAFTDRLPSGLLISTPNALAGSCGGGALTAATGSSSIALTGATLAGGTSCTFVLNVTATVAGPAINATSPVDSAEGGSGNSATAPIIVLAPPAAVISTPAAGAVYGLGQRVAARYRCQDDPSGPGVSSCVAPVAAGGRIDTAKLGVHNFTVTASSKDGLTHSTTVSYTIAPGPLITNVHESHTRWRLGTKLARISRSGAPVGTTFSLTINQSAAVRFAFTQTASGRRSGRRCVTQTLHNRRLPTCPRTLSVAALAFNGHAGVNTVAFQGRTSRHKTLPRGHYVVVITATTPTNQSAPRSLSFTIVKS